MSEPLYCEDWSYEINIMKNSRTAFTTLGPIGFSFWELIFKNYPVPSIDNNFVLVKYVQSGCNKNTDFQTVLQYAYIM